MSQFLMLIFLLILELKNLNTVLYNYTQENPIFTSTIYITSN